MKSFKIQFNIFFLVSVLYFAIPYIAGAQSYVIDDATYYYQQGEFEKSLNLLDRAIRYDPNQPQAWLMLISSYMEMEQFEQAESSSAEALKLFSAIPAFKWTQAEALLQQKRKGEALKIYQQLENDISEGESLEPLQVKLTNVRQRIGRLHQMLAMEAYQEQRVERAIDHMQKASEVLQDSLSVQKNLAALYLEQKRYDEMIAFINKVRKNFPEDTELLKMLASAHYKKKDHESVLQQFGEIYRLDSTDVDNGLIYAELLMANQRSQEGDLILEALNRQYPENRKIYRMLLDVSERRFNTDGKRAVLREMQKKFPDDYSILKEIAITYEAQEKWGSARAVYDSLQALTGEEVKYGLDVAETFIAQDSLQAAENQFNRLRVLAPENTEILIRKGRILENRLLWERAKNVYAEAIELSDQPDPELFVRAGVCAYHAGHRLDFGNYIKKAIELDSNNPEAYLYHAKLLSEHRNDDIRSARQAEQALRMSLKMMADRQQAMEAEIQREGIRSQAGNRHSVQEMERLDKLIKDSFNWFTESYTFTHIEPVLKSLIHTFSTSGRLYFMVGEYYRDQDRNDEALEYFQRAVQFVPAMADAHLAIAEISYRGGLIREAIISYERVNALEPKQSGAYKALIELYKENGNLDVLCDRWMARYRANSSNKVLRNHLIEALHKAGRFKEASEVIRNSRPD